VRFGVRRVLAALRQQPTCRRRGAARSAMHRHWRRCARFCARYKSYRRYAHPRWRVNRCHITRPPLPALQSARRHQLLSGLSRARVGDSVTNLLRMVALPPFIFKIGSADF
jgi:hypothetical protein